MTNAGRSLVAAAAVALLGSCQSAGTPTVTSQEPLVVNRALGGSTLGFYFLPPISWQTPSHFDGVFAADLSPTVRIDQVQFPSGDTITNVATLTATDRSVRRHPWREFYISRFDTSGLDPKNHYRVRVLVEDQELGAADFVVVKSPQDLKSVDTSRFVAVTVGSVLPIKFRIERRAADQDGDGVPDWRDNCPTIYNPPVPVPVLPTRPVTPPRCDYNKSDCDPQELDCDKPVILKQPDVCSCPGNGSSCPAPDACHTAGMCDPKTGACGQTAVADGTPCSDGNACNGLETCQAGVCTPGTPPTCSMADNPCTASTCDPVDGCKTVMVADGTSCPLPNATGACSSGICASPTCTSGFGDCDGNAANGCERDLTSDIGNCGTCGSSCVASCEASVFTEDWESGSGAWHAVDGNGITLTSDGSACDAFQRETISFSGGRVYTNLGTAVSAGTTYCLTAWVRGTPDAVPFLGFQISSASGNPTGAEHWLIGLPGYTTGYPGNDTVAGVTSDGNWAYYSKSFTMDAGTSDVVLKDENFGSGAADFDQIQLWAGACPAAPTSLCAAPAPSCTSPVCSAGVCSSAKL
ncbi:MAG TPA: hypothetical protein VMT03_20740 [Polyangia bacterium]|nr:hypothetical protein [Polyangia bacterium]